MSIHYTPAKYHCRKCGVRLLVSPCTNCDDHQRLMEGSE